MLYYIYNLIVCLGMICLFPFLIPRLIRGHYRSIIVRRLGFRLDFPKAAQGGIWVHALSVGEVRSAYPLLRALRKRFADVPLIFSVATRQGLITARELCAEIEDVHVMVRPLDVPWALRPAINAIQPALAILVESDIWPGWQRELGQAGVPRLLVNGRVSPRTFAGYRCFKFFVKPMLNGFEQILVQSELDRSRLVSVGVDPQRIAVGGNLKYDGARHLLTAQERKTLTKELGFGDRPILVAGSTHPGEEKKILTAFKQLRAQYPDLGLILAPRRIERGEEVALLAKTAGFSCVRVSGGQAGPQDAVLVLDRLGLLAKVYALGRAAFVGGSWVDTGGHNLLEPAAQRVPQAFGPILYNFLEMAEKLIEAGGGMRVKDANELAAVWGRWLEAPHEAEAVGQRGLEFCRMHRGAVERALNSSGQLMRPRL